MKKNFEKIKLNKFSNAELEQRKLNALKGGCICAVLCSDCAHMCNTSEAPNSMSDQNAYRWLMASGLAYY